MTTFTVSIRGDDREELTEVEIDAEDADEAGKLALEAFTANLSVKVERAEPDEGYLQRQTDRWM